MLIPRIYKQVATSGPLIAYPVVINLTKWRPPNLSTHNHILLKFNFIRMWLFLEQYSVDSRKKNSLQSCCTVAPVQHRLHACHVVAEGIETHPTVEGIETVSRVVWLCMQRTRSTQNELSLFFKWAITFFTALHSVACAVWPVSCVFHAHSTLVMSTSFIYFSFYFFYFYFFSLPFNFFIH
jgi:hypothetical protein